MTALLVTGGICVAFLSIMMLAAHEIFQQGAASERQKQAAAKDAAVRVSKEVADEVAKKDVGAMCDELSRWMRDTKR